MLCRIHGFIEATEMADAEDFVANQGPQLQLEFRCEGQRALRANKDMSHVVVVIARNQSVDVIATNAALNLGKAFGDFAGFPRAQRQQIAKQGLSWPIRIEPDGVLVHRTEPQNLAAGKRGFHRDRIVSHGAVTQRPPTAGIVSCHAADRGAGCRRDVNGEPQAVPFELAVEIIEHDTGLDNASAVFDVERQNTIQVLSKIDNNAVVDGLSAL